MTRTLRLWVIGLGLLGGCTLGDPVLPVEVPPASPGAMIVDDVTPIPACPIERVEVTLLPRNDRVVFQAAPPKKSPGRELRVSTLQGPQVVASAHAAARQEPQVGQYVGGELVYPWVQGQLYTIYLSPTMGTGIFLPPGDLVVKGLFLDPEAFDVTVQRAGVGDDAFDSLVIRPTQPSGSVDTFLLTTGGRRYLLRFVIGKQGMLAVTFQAPRLARPALPPDEPPLILPKPPA